MRAANIKRYTMLEGGAGLQHAAVRLLPARWSAAADEFAKPNEKRLEEFGDSGKQSLELKLFSKRPIYHDFEIVKLADSLGLAVRTARLPTIRSCRRCWPASRRSERAAELINGTKLNDVDVPQEALRGRQGSDRTPPTIR